MKLVMLVFLSFLHHGDVFGTNLFIHHLISLLSALAVFYFHVELIYISFEPIFSTICKALMPKKNEVSFTTMNSLKVSEDIFSFKYHIFNA